MNVYSRAPGKMILIGEYAVLEGAPAIVKAVDRYAGVEISDNSAGNFSVEAPNLGVPPHDFVMTQSGKIRFDPNGIPSFVNRLGFFGRLFETVWSFYHQKNIKIDYCKIVLDTASFYDIELNAKIGVGSSAALTAALVKAVDQWVNGNRSLSKKEIFLLALKAHRRAQKGIGSGIDIASSVYGGIVEYKMVKEDEKDFEEPVRLHSPDDLQIISVWTGKSASTRKMVGSIGEFKNVHYLRYKEIMDNLSRVSRNACSAFKSKDTDSFLQCCGEYYRLLLRLGEEGSVSIVSDVHKNIERIVRDSGGIYKPSGAGSGDFGIALSADEENASSIRFALQKNGYKTVDLEISETGAMLY